jgi:hypothetical protein
MPREAYAFCLLQPREQIRSTVQHGLSKLLRQHGGAETLECVRHVKYFLCVAVHQRNICTMHTAGKARWRAQGRAHATITNAALCESGVSGPAHQHHISLSDGPYQQSTQIWDGFQFSKQVPLQGWQPSRSAEKDALFDGLAPLQLHVAGDQQMITSFTEVGQGRPRHPESLYGWGRRESLRMPKHRTHPPIT